MERKIREKGETQQTPKETSTEQTVSVETQINVGEPIKKDLVNRKGSFLINPKLIVMDLKDKAGNPRWDYGDDFEELKESITQYGVQQPLKLYKSEDDKWHLAHGYRRMKAVTELLEAGVNVESVPFDEVPYDEQQILIEHFTLNTGKPLNDVEMAEGLKRLSILSGDTNVKNLAKRVGIDYQKAHNLMNFIGRAGTKIKTEVAKGSISFNVGYSIAKTAESVSEQNELLKEGIKNAKESGTNKVRGKHISKINRDTMPFDIKLKLALTEAQKDENADKNLIEVFTNLVDAVKNNEEIGKIVALLKIAEPAHSEE